MKLPSILQQLIDELCHWPAVGPKTAERYVWWLISQPAERLRALADNLYALPQTIAACLNCGFISNTNPCSICADSDRQTDQLCLVANSRDLLIIEDTGQYRGRYLVLGQKLDSLVGVNPEQLNLRPLLQKLANQTVKEIILAFDPDLAGETTALYLQKILKSYNLTISRLAQGLPTGATLEYADQNTLANAFKNRRQI